MSRFLRTKGPWAGACQVTNSPIARVRKQCGGVPRICFFGEASVSDDANGKFADVDLRPLVGLLADIPEPVIEHLTIEAIRVHRKLVDKAEALFNALPDNLAKSAALDNEAYIAYLQVTIEMHAQMSALTTLLKLLGRTPQA
ncbi:Transcriptional repressor TraM [compost metagenome]